MSAPLVTPSRDALAKALFAINEPIGEGWADRFDPSRRETYLTMADALLASGVVRAADTLADDVALVEHIANFVPLGFTSRDPYDTVGEAAENMLRALAVALDAR